MNGLYITVDGVVGSDPKRFVWNGDPIISFRFVAKERRYDRSRGGWVDGHSSWMTVSCFRALAKNVDESVRKGDRLIVHGKIQVKDFVTADGTLRTGVNLEADSVGHNLTFGTARFRPARIAENAQDQIRAQADTLAGELAGEPVEDVEALIAERIAQADAEHDGYEPDDDRLDDDPVDDPDDDPDDEPDDDEAFPRGRASFDDRAGGSSTGSPPGQEGSPQEEPAGDRGRRRGSRKVLAGVAG